MGPDFNSEKVSKTSEMEGKFSGRVIELPSWNNSRTWRVSMWLISDGHSFHHGVSVSSLFESRQTCDCLYQPRLAAEMLRWFCVQPLHGLAASTPHLWEANNQTTLRPPCYEKFKPHVEALEEETHVERERLRNIEAQEM